MPDKELTRAGFGPRAAAYIIDRVLLLIALAIVRAPFAVAALFGAGRLTAQNFIFDHSVLDVVCWLLASAYFVLLTWFGGATLGKMVMRLRVCREDGEDMRFIDVLYRETVGRFLSGILCLGYLMVLADKRKRGFHDWLCGTCVVYDGVRFRSAQKRVEPADCGWSEPGREAPAAGAIPAAAGYAVPAYSLPGGAVVPAGAESVEVSAPEEPDEPEEPEEPTESEEPMEPTEPEEE